MWLSKVEKGPGVSGSRENKKELTEATENDNSNTEEVETKMMADAVEVDQGADGALENEGIMIEYELVHDVGVDSDYNGDYDSEIRIWMRYLARLANTKLLNWNANFKGKKPYFRHMYIQEILKDDEIYFRIAVYNPA